MPNVEGPVDDGVKGAVQLISSGLSDTLRGGEGIFSNGSVGTGTGTGSDMDTGTGAGAGSSSISWDLRVAASCISGSTCATVFACLRG